MALLYYFLFFLSTVGVFFLFRCTSTVYTFDGHCDESLFSLERNDIAVTSLYSKDGDVYYRGVKLPSNENTNGDYADFTIVNEKIL